MASENTFPLQVKSKWKTVIKKNKKKVKIDSKDV